MATITQTARQNVSQSILDSLNGNLYALSKTPSCWQDIVDARIDACRAAQSEGGFSFSDVAQFEGCRPSNVKYFCRQVNDVLNRAVDTSHAAQLFAYCTDSDLSCSHVLGLVRYRNRWRCIPLVDIFGPDPIGQIRQFQSIVE